MSDAPIHDPTTTDPWTPPAGDLPTPDIIPGIPDTPDSPDIRPEPGPPAPIPDLPPGYDPGPPVRTIDPAPDGPIPTMPVDGPVGSIDRPPGDPGVH
jgi:hypothetical protein